MIDTHAHLNLKQFDEDRSAVVRRAQDAGVHAVINIGIDETTSRRALEIAAEEPGQFASVGLHPNSCAGAPGRAWIEELLADPRVVAIGETGLDEHWQQATAVEQEESFLAHIDLASRRNLPLVVHVRKAEDRVLDVLASAPRVRGVWHCFSGDQAHARRALDLGLHLGIGGVATFKNSDRTEVIEYIPRDRLLLETDCPFLAPHPHRGRRNEPAYIPLILVAVAAAWRISPAEAESATDAAAIALFGAQLAPSSRMAQ